MFIYKNIRFYESDYSANIVYQKHQKDFINMYYCQLQRTPTSLRQPLFNLVRSSSYDQIVAVEVPLSSRDLLVAETGACGLTVTKVNKKSAVKQGDW